LSGSAKIREYHIRLLNNRVRHFLPSSGETRVTQGPNGARELLIETNGHVRLLTLNRPERRNALSASLRNALSEALLSADEDEQVRVVVLTGTGEQAFCAGADLKDLRAGDDSRQTFRPPMGQVERSVFEVALETKKPVIAALNGSAVAGGFELALACDLRITHPDAQFGLPEAKIGMGANFSSVLLPRLIAPCIALEMLMTGDYISAEQAYRYGLLNRIVPRGEVLQESLAMANKIAENAPLSVRRMKATAWRGMDMPVATALRLDLGPSPYLSEDRKEGIKARLEKRKPVWQGR
jgi:enoyl-CoA hydratase